MGNFKKFTNLSKDFGELDDKLIIQHFRHIHTMTYTIYSLHFSTLKIIQEFETLMQDFIKKVINIHKYKFFFLILCRLAGRPARDAGRASVDLRAHYLGLPRVFSADPRARP